MVIPSIEEALDSLMSPERQRLNFCFEQGNSAIAKIKQRDGLYVGCHMDQLIHMELLLTEGKWSIGRKKKEES